ncbi:cation efflux system protein [Escherichia coli]|uniref:Cation efflux system protein n=1 Tax=Escherichia coli TaxID=562 RepID=A0A376MUB2_ECOLX|nr:cation efflux system protein [Escherichia coli]
MIEWIIRRSVANRFLVLMGALFLSIWGTWTIINTPVDALPDLSDVQVIIKTSYPGQAPQIVENQVTYPLTTTMLSVPGAKTVRGFSQFGDSYVYVIFEDGTDPYWARSRCWSTSTRYRVSCLRESALSWARCHGCWLDL